MEKFTILKSTAVPLSTENVDTDQIIPARFLKTTERKGFGDNLFRDQRYDAETGEPIESFPLNDSRYGGKILLAGKNFGCGSSREHAAWALYDYGFRAVVSDSFADIFANNALNNGLLPVRVSMRFISECFAEVASNPNATFTIDLERETITIDSSSLEEHFPIDAYKKECLMNGYDDVDYLVSLRDEIAEYEKRGKRI